MLEQQHKQELNLNGKPLPPSNLAKEAANLIRAGRISKRQRQELARMIQEQQLREMFTPTPIAQAIRHQTRILQHRERVRSLRGKQSSMTATATTPTTPPESQLQERPKRQQQQIIRRVARGRALAEGVGAKA